jgi:hypothetical protein
MTNPERAVTTLQKLTIELEASLAEKLCAVAKEADWTPESLAADCVAQHLEIATRFRVLVERFEQIDNNLAAIASVVGDASAGSDGADLWKICRWRREHEKQ